MHAEQSRSAPLADGIAGDILSVGPRTNLANRLLADLRDRGFRVMHVAYAPEARELLSAAVPAALIAPAISSDEVLRLVKWVRSESRLALLPIILVARQDAGRNRYLRCPL